MNRRGELEGSRRGEKLNELSLKRIQIKRNFDNLIQIFYLNKNDEEKFLFRCLGDDCHLFSISCLPLSL